MRTLHHLAGIVAFAAALCIPVTAQTGSPEAFDAPMIVALTDADMVPSAYVDGRLGPAAGHDGLTVLRFDGRSLRPSYTAAVSVSASVAGPSAPMAITPDGRFAIVLETRGPRPASGKDVGIAGLSLARTITIIDLADASGPRVVQVVDGPRGAAAASISRDGALVAVGVSAEGDGKTTPLWLFRWRHGRLGEGQPIEIPGWTPGDELTGVAFSPDDKRLALVDQTRDTLAIYDLTDTGDRFGLTRWGNAIPTERYPFIARWSPDGRFILVNAYYAGGSLPKPPYLSPPGTVSAIRIDAQRDEQGRPLHIVTDHQTVGRGPEGLTVSPDGRLVVSVNMEASYFPEADPRRTRYSTLTLLRLDPESGALERLDEPAFDGLLPESAVFDRDGSHLAVASYGQFDDPRGAGSIDMWRVVTDAQDHRRVRLVQTRTSVPLGRGVFELATAGPR